MDTRLSFNQNKVLKWVLVVALISSMIVITTCIICDYFITKGFDWSFIVMLSIVTFWIFIPYTVGKEKGIRNALIVLSIVSIPFLFVLSLILGIQLVFTLGGCISFICCLSLWGIYFIFLKYQKLKLRAFGYSLLLTIPLMFGIIWISNFFIESYTIHRGSVIFQLMMTILLAISCFVVEYLKKASFKLESRDLP